jgi:aminoglycoside 2'-N-acetyltransferase I
MAPGLSLKTLRSEELTPEVLTEILEMCNRAYEEDLDALFKTFNNPTHVLGYENGTLASHAMWVRRWLQAGDGPLLRTAYVEMVATEPRLQRRGLATAVMRRLAEAIAEYDLGALCTGSPEFYARLGWVDWRGPLFIRSQGGLIPTPDELVMVLALPGTPALDLEQALSAEWREGELW